MPLRVSGKNMDIGDALRSKVEARVASTLAKYFPGNHSGHVTVERDGTGFRTECVLHLTSGITLEASSAAHDAHASFDQTAERIEARLRRHVQKLKERPNHRAEPETPPPIALQDNPQHLPQDEAHPLVIAETTAIPARLAVSDAVVELDRKNEAALVFVHAGTGRLNVVYRRRDGAIGWVDPPVQQN